MKDGGCAYQLQRKRDHAEIEYLDGRPDDVIGFPAASVSVAAGELVVMRVVSQRGDENGVELAAQGLDAAALGRGHEGKEEQQADGRKDELVKHHPPDGRGRLVMQAGSI